MHINDWHWTIWPSQKQITVTFALHQIICMLMVVVVLRGINNSILYFDTFSNFICGEYCIAYAYEWVIHSRIQASQSNRTVNFRFTSTEWGSRVWGTGQIRNVRSAMNSFKSCMGGIGVPVWCPGTVNLDPVRARRVRSLLV